jgi:hypothetical protein
MEKVAKKTSLKFQKDSDLWQDAEREDSTNQAGLRRAKGLASSITSGKG